VYAPVRRPKKSKKTGYQNGPLEDILTTSRTDTSPDRDSSGYALVILALAVLAALVGIIQLFPVQERLALIAERGPVEDITIVGYGVCVALMMWRWPLGVFSARWYFSALCILFAAREMDFDKSLFTVGLLKSRQYVGDMVSLPEKALSLFVLVGVIAVVVSILRYEMRDFAKGVIALSASPLAVLAAVLMIVSTKLLDGIGRKLAPYGIEISESMDRFAYVFEEVGELGIPLFFAVAILTSSAARAAD
jgi:hypothetical protein